MKKNGNGPDFGRCRDGFSRLRRRSAPITRAVAPAEKAGGPSGVRKAHRSKGTGFAANKSPHKIS